MLRLVGLLIAFGLISWLITFLPLTPPWPMLIFVAMIATVIWEVLAVRGVTRSLINRG